MEISKKKSPMRAMKNRTELVQVWRPWRGGIQSTLCFRFNGACRVVHGNFDSWEPKWGWQWDFGRSKARD